jgi:hypothetical protein
LNVSDGRSFFPAHAWINEPDTTHSSLYDSVLWPRLLKSLRMTADVATRGFSAEVGAVSPAFPAFCGACDKNSLERIYLIKKLIHYGFNSEVWGIALFGQL